MKNLRSRGVNCSGECMNKYQIYADNAATTKLDSDALAQMYVYLQDEYGNPSALYSKSKNPRKAVEEARRIIAEQIGSFSNEIYFTSCGTESDNWAIKGVAYHYIGEKKRIITSCIEHHAVLYSCSFLEKIGFDVVYLPVDNKGRISATELEAVITKNTILVSIMMANNEIGTIQAIKELAAIVHKHNVIFHTDAVQAVGHIPVDVHQLDVDMLSASAHKFNGPKGTGFLYIKNGVKVENLLSGGGQENRYRAGTENVAGIVGMAYALKKNSTLIDQNAEYLRSLEKYFWDKMKKSGLEYISNGADWRIPGSISVSIKDASGEMILHRLDLMGIAVSTGSACNSQETELSHVLKAIAVPEEYALGTIRITLGIDNTIEDIDKIVAGIIKILNK